VSILVQEDFHAGNNWSVKRAEECNGQNFNVLRN
jgi:hypothetical protein